MKSEENFLSIIIVSYHVRDLLSECLTSVKQFVSLPHEVIVIDNNSSDGTVEMIKEEFPESVLIENKANVGFSAANNQGFDIARGNLLLMLNPDARLIDDSLNSAVAFLSHQNSRTLIGPRILNPDGSYQVSCWKFPRPAQHFVESIFLNKVLDVTGYEEAASADKNLKVDFISGAAVLMQRQTQLNIGKLDELLFWMDDVDFCYRNQMQQGQCIYYPQWKIAHHIGQSSKKNLGLVLSNQLISKLKFYRKYGRKTAFTATAFIFFGHIKLRLILLLLPAVFSSGSRYKLKAYWYALKKLLRYLFKNDQTIS